LRKLLNTLYVTTPEAFLSLDGNNAVLLLDGKAIFRIPVTNLESVVCFNYLGASPKFMQYCTDRNINISFMTPNGRYMAGINGRIKGNVLLRKKQYFVSEDTEFCLNIAKNIIVAKLFNCRYEVNRSVRDNKDKIDVSALERTSEELKNAMTAVGLCRSMEELRGVEGDAARQYFSTFNDMIVRQKTDFVFSGRTRRPPLDNVNALLSFGYALLAHEVEAALLCVGLDPYVGFMHTDRPGRISLALDMMEEFRVTVVDRFVLTLINLKQINADDFMHKESEGILMTEVARKVFLTEWQKRKQEDVVHGFIGEKMKAGLIPYAQAMILSRYLRNEINDYAPYFKR